ncbi:MAG: Stk1 family PASTA domain-containing Ser/Thr kinase [Clostridiales bacterium]
MIQLGTVLNNRFQIEELVGSGGMSLIFRATDLVKHRTVAIKMLREQYVGDPVFVARFRREGQAVAGLDHPNIVKIYSVCQDQDVYYLVLELVEGRDLKQLLQSRDKPFEPREIYPIAAQICDAIYYAHHKNIIHRDIKPHNIIAGSDGQIKVTDFGIARAASEATVTHTGNIMGSVHYLSPEQAKGELADHRSDIYSLGVLLYEMATGKLPFEGESPISVALQKIQQDPVAPGAANPDVAVPEALEQVILKAMDRNPQRRYQSALQLKDDLREACFNNRLLYAREPEIDHFEDTLSGDDLSKIKGMGLREQEELMAGGVKNAPKSTGKTAVKGGSGKGKNGKKPLPVFLVILIFVGLAAGGLALGMYVSNLLYSPAADVEVPAVVGKTQEQALQELEASGLKGIISEDKVVRESIPLDHVAVQDPIAATPVKPGSTIRLTLSKGPATRPVPYLIGQTQQAAVIALGNASLELGKVETINDSKTPEGIIMGQNPVAGTPLKAGEKVDIIISLGPVIEMVKVQSFLGMPITEAQEAARSLGIEFGYTSYEMSWDYAKDTIIRQTPAPDTEMQIGTPIDIVVSLGPGPSR